MGHWLIDTSGIGSIVVLGVGFCVLVAYILMLRWIQAAPPDPVPVEVGSQDEENIAVEPGGEEA